MEISGRLLLFGIRWSWEVSHRPVSWSWLSLLRETALMPGWSTKSLSSTQLILTLQHLCGLCFAVFTWRLRAVHLFATNQYRAFRNTEFTPGFKHPLHTWTFTDISSCLCSPSTLSLLMLEGLLQRWGVAVAHCGDKETGSRSSGKYSLAWALPESASSPTKEPR